MPGLGVQRIQMGRTTLEALLRHRLPDDDAGRNTYLAMLQQLQQLPDDAVLLEIRPAEGGTGEKVLVWEHPNFPRESTLPEAYTQVEPRIPEAWTYIR